MKRKKLDHVQKNVKNLKQIGAKCFRPSHLDDLIKNYQKGSPVVLETDCGLETNQRSSDNESLGSVMEGIFYSTTPQN